MTERLAGWTTSESVIWQLTCDPLGVGVGVGPGVDGIVHDGLAAPALPASTVSVVALATADSRQVVARTAIRLDLCIRTASA